MKCERCKEKEANVFLEQTINGESKSMHLCEACAAAVKKEGFFEGAPFPFGTDLFGDLFGFTAPHRLPTAGKACPKCGATFAAIRREGKVSCPHCYEFFREELAPTVQSLHGRATHNGRAPAGLRFEREKKTKLDTLRRELRAAVEDEQYEKAAQLRDQIRSLEKEGD